MIPAAITGTPATAGTTKQEEHRQHGRYSGIGDRNNRELSAPGIQLQTRARMPATAKTQPAERTPATVGIKAKAPPIALSNIFFQHCLENSNFMNCEV
jgi:hypothetical protein